MKRILDDITEKLPDLFSMMDLEERTADERPPFTSVFLQECERMNGLLFEMRRSLVELDLGLKGDLSISEPMEVRSADTDQHRPPSRPRASATATPRPPPFPHLFPHVSTPLSPRFHTSFHTFRC